MFSPSIVRLISFLTLTLGLTSNPQELNVKVINNSNNIFFIVLIFNFSFDKIDGNYNNK
jgi:hypothetical protein